MNATVLSPYESSTHADLAQWIAEQRRAGADKLILRRRTDDTGSHELVCTKQIEGEVNGSELAGLLLRMAQDEGRFFAGVSVYGVFSSAGRHPLSRFFFDVQGEQAESAFTVSPNRDVNLANVTAQLMRHAETSANLAVGQTVDIIGHYKALLAARDRRVEQLEKKYAEVFLMHEKLLSMQHQRDMEVRKLELDAKVKDATFEQLKAVGPMIRAHLENGAANGQLGKALEGFMSSLSPEQMEQILSALGPSQARVIIELYQKFAAKHGVKPESAPSAADATKGATS